MAKESLSEEQSKFINGMIDCIDLYNQLVEKVTATGLKVDTACWADGHIEVSVFKDIRTIDINFGGKDRKDYRG